MKKRLMVTSGIIIVLIGVILLGYEYMQYASYELVSDEIVIELGDSLSTDASDYVLSNSKAIKATQLDFSNVDTMTVGEYQATASYKDNTLPITVIVEDTTVPDVVLANDGTYQTVAGQPINASDIVSSMDDLSGIQNVSFADAEIVDETNEDMLGAIILSYDSEGDYTNSITVTDNNGNTTTVDVSIHVIEDYAQHISGFHDWTVEQGADIDFTDGVTTDERIVCVEVDAESIDVATVGTYELIYNIAGDDGNTVIQETVNVEVVDSVTSQELANNGNTVIISGNKTKQKAIENNLSENTTVAATSGETSSSSSNSTTSSRAQRDAEARVIAQQIADSATGTTDLERVESAMSMIYNNYTVNLTYSETAPYYNEPYGVFFDGYATCAGVTRAMGMVLECMGFQWTHAHENQHSHQWCELTMDGQVGYADASMGFAGYGVAIGELSYQ